MESLFEFEFDIDEDDIHVNGRGRGAGSPQALLGQTAPPFELELLDGDSMALAEHSGQDIVILDFWATWCGPCIRAMPHQMEVAEEYRDQNVVFYAINQRERDQTVSRFLEQREWDLTVPMDRDGSVGGLYNVRGIPQTVIIGRDGTVQAVHVGFSPRLGDRLRRELDTLLAGEHLVEPAEAGGE